MLVALTPSQVQKIGMVVSAIGNNLPLIVEPVAS